MPLDPGRAAHVRSRRRHRAARATAAPCGVGIVSARMAKRVARVVLDGSREVVMLGPRTSIGATFKASTSAGQPSFVVDMGAHFPPGHPQSTRRSSERFIPRIDAEPIAFVPRPLRWRPMARTTLRFVSRCFRGARGPRARGTGRASGVLRRLRAAKAREQWQENERAGQLATGCRRWASREHSGRHAAAVGGVAFSGSIGRHEACPRAQPRSSRRSAPANLPTRSLRAREAYADVLQRLLDRRDQVAGARVQRVSGW